MSSAGTQMQMEASGAATFPAPGRDSCRRRASRSPVATFLDVWQGLCVIERPDTDPLQDAFLIARQQWQLNETRELVRCFARDGNGMAPPEAFAYLDLIVETVVEGPERAMSISAEIYRFLGKISPTVDAGES